MRCSLVLEFEDGDSTALRLVELARLHREVADPKPGDVGLSLAEGKTLLQAEDSSSIAIVVAAVGPVGKPPRVLASALPRSKRLQIERSKFLKDSGYEPSNRVYVFPDGTRDLAAVATALPHASRWVLDWSHIGRMLQYVDQAIAPLAYGRLASAGSVFELWDLFVHFRRWVWAGETKRWKVAGERLCEMLALREQGEPAALRKRAQAARYKPMDLLYNLQENLRSLIDYRSWQRAGRRICTDFVKSTINRIVGRRMCEGQQMRWSQLAAHHALPCPSSSNTSHA